MLTADQATRWTEQTASGLRSFITGGPDGVPICKVECLANGGYAIRAKWPSGADAVSQFMAGGELAEVIDEAEATLWNLGWENLEQAATNGGASGKGPAG